MATVIYYDSVKGIDNISNGTARNRPLKTIDYFVDNIAVKNGVDYIFVLDEGEYTFKQSTFQSFQNCTLEVYGNDKKTKLTQTTGIASNASPTGYTTLHLIFKRLIYNIDLSLTGANLNTFNWKWTFENTVFDNIPNNGYAVFLPYQAMYVKNSVRTSNSTNLLRTTNGIINVTDSYGAFTSGYNTTESNWSVGGYNHITPTPSLTSDFGRVDGNTSNGVFSGVSSWRYKGIWFFNERILIHNNGEVYTMNPEIISPLTAVPIMTSDTLPSGTVFYESQYNNNYAWLAFNGASSANGYLANGKTGYLGYKFPFKKNISKYSIKSSTSDAYFDRLPKNWVFEGSNDNRIWDILDERLNQSWNKKDSYNIYEFKNKKLYTLYRIRWTDNNGNASYTSIDELQMFEVISNTHVKSIPSQSEQNFIKHGMPLFDLASIDQTEEFIEKHYIQDSSTPLGSGKVFEHKLDMNKEMKKLIMK